MTQHEKLDVERWARFDLDQQILMIGNEMNRTSRGVQRGDSATARLGYERVLRLTDLTVAARPRRALLRELLRWRELVAALYAQGSDAASHRAAFRALLFLRPAAAKQARHLGIGRQPSR